MDIGELIAVGLFKQESAKCPFNIPVSSPVSEDPEDIAKDDLDSVTKIQENDGGKLGRNLSTASHGAPGTINDIYPAAIASPTPPIDTKRNGGGNVKVEKDQKEYPYAVAAHHLIPGEASLAKSRLYEKYLKKGGKIKTRSGKEYIIAENIGYNVNGAHNGVWLPGNYAIRETSSPESGISWGKLGLEYEEWCGSYMLACVKKANAQFHDSHPTYNDKVLGILNRIHRALVVHQDSCEECKGKDTIPPPYVLKTRLYVTSRYLRGKLKAIPGRKWKIPWYTSERFRAVLVKANLLG